MGADPTYWISSEMDFDDPAVSRDPQCTSVSNFNTHSKTQLSYWWFSNYAYSLEMGRQNWSCEAMFHIRRTCFSNGLTIHKVIIKVRHNFVIKNW